MSSGSCGQLDGVEATGAHRGEQRGALDQLVAGQRVQAALGRAGAAVVGAADALQERGDAAGRADLAHQLDRADVDAELERRGGDQRLQLAGAQAGLDPVAAVLRQAAVVGGDDVVAEALAELVREPLGQAAGVDEHERGAVLADERGDAVEHVAHLLGRGDRLELAVGQLEREVEGRAGGRRRRSTGSGRSPTSSRPTVSIGRCVADRPIRAGRVVAQRLEPLEREREVRAALVARDGVDLVDDHRLDRAQRVAAPLAGDEQVERLGRGDHEARRLAHHRGALRAGGVAGAHRRPGCSARRARARRRPRRSRASGRSRFSAMSTASALSGDT